MKLKAIPIVLCLAISLPSSAMAAAAFTTSSTISTLNGRDVGLDVYLPQTNNPMGCSNAGIFRLLPSATNYNTVASVIMSAQAQQKQISVYANGCDANDGASTIAAAKM